MNTDAAKGQKKTKMTGKCFRCTRIGHPAFACKATCYCKLCKSDTHAEGAKYCKKDKGDAKKAPKKKWKSRQTDGEEDSGEEDDEYEDSEKTSYEEYNTRETKDTDESAHQMKETSKTAPFIQICFNAEGRKFQVDCVADTGSSKGIMSTRISNYNNLTVDKKRVIRLFNANGKRMTVEGVVTVKCYPKLINGKINKLQRKCIKTEFIVSSDLKSDILLSCTDLKKMGVIPEDFPNVTIKDDPEDSCMESSLDENMEGLSQAEMKEIHDLIKEFDDVLKDNIDDKQYIGSECDITFKKDIPIVPFKCVTARSPQLAFQQVCKEKIESMLRGGMITEDDSPSEWLARSHFVPKKAKNGEMRPRHVVNYQELNDQIERPVRGFMKINELRAGIQGDSEFLFVADLSDGYYQVKLTDNASKLTTFLCSTGEGAKQYRWLRCPQGLNLAGDEFNIRTDKLIDNVEKSLKLIDDLFTQAKTWKDYMMKIKQILENARKQKVYISRRKLQFGKRVIFAGFEVSTENGVCKVKPDPALLKNIREFPLPESLKTSKHSKV